MRSNEWSHWTINECFHFLIHLFLLILIFTKSHFFLLTKRGWDLISCWLLLLLWLYWFLCWLSGICNIWYFRYSVTCIIKVFDLRLWSVCDYLFWLSQWWIILFCHPLFHFRSNISPLNQFLLLFKFNLLSNSCDHLFWCILIN